MEHESVGRDPGGQGDVELPPGGHVENHALFVGQAGHGHAEEGLGGVGHTVSPRLHRLAAPDPKVRLVVDEQRRAIFLGELGYRDVLTVQLAIVIDEMIHGIR